MKHHGVKMKKSGESSLEVDKLEERARQKLANLLDTLAGLGADHDGSKSKHMYLYETDYQPDFNDTVLNLIYPSCYCYDNEQTAFPSYLTPNAQAPLLSRPSGSARVPKGGAGAASSKSRERQNGKDMWGREQDFGRYQWIPAEFCLKTGRFVSPINNLPAHVELKDCALSWCEGKKKVVEKGISSLSELISMPEEIASGASTSFKKQKKGSAAASQEDHSSHEEHEKMRSEAVRIESENPMHDMLSDLFLSVLPTLNEAYVFGRDKLQLLADDEKLEEGDPEENEMALANLLETMNKNGKHFGESGGGAKQASSQKKKPQGAGAEFATAASMKSCDSTPANKDLYSVPGTLQVIVKLLDYEFRDQDGPLGRTQAIHPSGLWHVEGQSHENIAAAALCVLRKDKDIECGQQDWSWWKKLHGEGASLMTPLDGAKQSKHSAEPGTSKAPSLVNQTIRFKRAFTVAENHELYSFKWLPPDHGVQDHLRSLELEAPAMPLGSAVMDEGSLTCFPNSHIHQVQEMRLNLAGGGTAAGAAPGEKRTEAEEVKTYTRRVAIFWVIDPNPRIVSSQDLSPLFFDPLKRIVDLANFHGAEVNKQAAHFNRMALMKERVKAPSYNVRAVRLQEEHCQFSGCHI
ncbi:unnamed protein product [Amoebophrya sp. A25]|nr:unnamed protein product [Amoebophrya sp. A25]|eukprot:GSA25T00006995001.1